MSWTVEHSIHRAGCYLSQPFWRATEYILNQEAGWKGSLQKVSGIALAILSTPFHVLGETFHAMAKQVTQHEYLSQESQAPISSDIPRKFLTLNACMFAGGLPIIFGGVSPAHLRMDALANFLNAQNADIVCLQEVALDAATLLIKKLESVYRFFYYHIGPYAYRMESALFLASKVPLKKEPTFIPFHIPSMQQGIRRGFFVAEFKYCLVINTHLDPHIEQGEIRAQQIEAIISYTKEIKKPILLMGDLNIEPQDVRAHALLKDYFSHFKEEDVLHPTQDNATCNEDLFLMAHNSQIAPKWAVLDHILTRNISQPVFLQRIETFHPNHLSSALSDHHAVVLTLKRAL